VTKHGNVLSEIVASGFCCGCGICAGICSPGSIQMRLNDLGEYNPFPTENACTNCGVCLLVCPFSDRVANESALGQRWFASVDRVQHTDETGYFLTAFSGYSKVRGHRENGSSGGMATWGLENLLSRHEVDAAICVSPSSGKNGRLFSYTDCRTAEQVRASSRSCYYPVEMSAIIRKILANDGQYIVTGLPCFCKSLRLAMEISPPLRKKIKFIFGLVCGQNKSRFFVECLCAMAGCDPHHLDEVVFRVKDRHRPASDYGVHFRCNVDKATETRESVFWSEGMGRIWLDR